ncbi:MAG: metal ABC transporter substrate-binding protein [Verrucomicrobiota bacterium]
MLRLLLASFVCALLPLSAAELKVAVLHPLLGDLARQVGGDRVEVIDLIGANGDPHHFEPNPEDIRKARGASLYLVAGMGLEGYLPKLRSVITDKAKLVEVGATLPALEEADDGHGHASHVDPHWWHSVKLFSRATDVVAEAMAAQAPHDAEVFRSNAAAYRKQLDALEKWSRREISRIPRDRRHLATAHAAFNYFCHDFGFTPHPVQGLNREQMPDPRKLAELVASLKAAHVAAVFPEKESNPKILSTLTRDTGIKLGDPLIADGTGGITYEAMVRHNVNAIVKGLE